MYILLAHRVINMNTRFNIGYFSSVGAQVMLLIFSSMAMIHFFYKPVNSFSALDPKSFVKQATPAVIKQWGHEPLRIKTGLLIHEFLTFDMTGNNFIVNAVIYFEFDQTKISLDTLSKFEFTKGDVIQKSDPIVKKISDNLTFAQYYVRLQFSAMFDYERFPLDDHRLTLNFTNRAIQADQVLFDVAAVDFIVPEYVFIDGWKIVEHTPISGYAEFVSLEEEPVRHPKILFYFGIKKQQSRKILLIFIPLLMFFYLGIFQLAVRNFLTNLNTMISVITAFMVWAISIQMMSPKVDYFMLIDYFILLLMVITFFIYGTMFLGTWFQNIWSPDSLAKLQGGAVIVIYTAFMFLSYYLIHLYKVG